MIGTRHRLVHAYTDVNYDVIWETVATELSTLIAQLERILDQPSV